MNYYYASAVEITGKTVHDYQNPSHVTPDEAIRDTDRIYWYAEFEEHFFG